MPPETSRLPLPTPGEDTSADALLDRFLGAMAERGIELYPAQEEAILELYAGKHVILNTPTGSGKSLVAEALHFKAFSEGKLSVYTCPIKALVNEKFFALCEAFGPENVGMMTGDATVNRDAKIICCTAEILANMSLRETGANVDYVLMDEFHYYADKERGVAWQIPLLSLPHATFLLMSATLGTTAGIEESLHRISGREVTAVRRAERPVPLEYEYRETPLHETIADLVEHNRHPIYLVNFTQRSAAEQAQALTSVNLTTREEKEIIRQTLFDVSFDSPYGKELERFLRAGIGLHHAGLLPKYRRVTERLARKGVLKVISGTDTLGVGVNIPIRTVLFTQLSKFNGQKVAVLSVRDFHQIGGRAGRKGFDEKGYVVVQAPEHVIENLKLEAKAKAGKKITRKQPPEGFVSWDRATMDRLLTNPPEALEPRFDVTHGLLMNLLQVNDLWPRGGYGRLVELIRRSHGSAILHQRHLKRAAAAFKALRLAEVVEVIRGGNGEPARVKVSDELQKDFSLNYTLSLYLVEVVKTLDPETPTYALDVLTMVESILETPDVLIWRQLDKLKEAKINELKSQGVPYEERMIELEKVEPLKPNASYIYGTFAAFAQAHPWVGGEDIRPKSIARDMIERYCTFNEYVREYGLQRSEGVLLRYLMDTYRAMSQTVPEVARNEAVEDLIEHLRITIRTVDSSLLDEWEAMQAGGDAPTAPRLPDSPLKVPSEQERLAKDPKALAARVRGELHRLLRSLALKQYTEALTHLAPLEGEPVWTAESLEAEMAPYFAEHPQVLLTHEARLPHNTMLRPAGGPLRFEATQKIVSPDGQADWALEAIVDLSMERAPNTPVIALRRILH